MSHQETFDGKNSTLERDLNLALCSTCLETRKKASDDMLDKDAFIDKVREVLTSIETVPGGCIMKDAAKICMAGKHLRPRIIMEILGGSCGNNFEITPSLIRDVSAIELIHTSTLMHDDIIDGSSFRRKQKTLNALYNNEIAILVGNIVKDYGLSIASEAARPILNSASLDVNLGQLWETEARSMKSLNMADYLKISLYKAGKMFRYSAQMAALHGAKGIEEPQKVALELVAIAYQAFDDFIDYSGASAFAGKETGRDTDKQIHSFIYALWPQHMCSANRNVADESIAHSLAALSEIKNSIVSGGSIATQKQGIPREILICFCRAIETKATALSGDCTGVVNVVKRYMSSIINSLQSQI